MAPSLPASVMSPVGPDERAPVGGQLLTEDQPLCLQNNPPFLNMSLNLKAVC